MFEKVLLKNSSQYNKKKQFKISNYNPFFVNEVKGYKLSRLPKFKDTHFWKKKKYKNIDKIIVVSGPGRSGNHIVISLLDPISKVVGEDSFLINILSLANKDEKKLIKNLKSGNKNFYLKLSGYSKNGKIYNKWLDTFKIYKKIEKKTPKEKKKYLIKKNFVYSGLQKPGDKFDLDFRLHVPKLNYKAFENYFIKNQNKFKNIKNIFEFIELYLEASQILTGVSEKYLQKKRFMFGSGMRRESFFLLNNYIQKHFLICPIRNFNDFAISHLLPQIVKKKIIKKGEIRKKIFLFYDMWFHKVLDYLILKNMYPKNVIIIKFEDLIFSRKKTLKLLFKKIKEPIKKINLKPTILKKKVLGNSSYDFTKNKNFKISRTFKKKIIYEELKKKIIHCDEYKDMLLHINKVKLR